MCNLKSQPPLHLMLKVFSLRPISLLLLPLLLLAFVWTFGFRMPPA